LTQFNTQRLVDEALKIPGPEKTGYLVSGVYQEDKEG
jgi:hypothetical protein